jgi:hypothetical protein
MRCVSEIGLDFSLGNEKWYKSGFSPWDRPFSSGGMIARREEGLSQGLKPDSRLFLNVWAKAQTYLRDNSNNKS